MTMRQFLFMTTTLLMMGMTDTHAQEEDRYLTIELGLINKTDTLRWCWADTWTEEGKRCLQLAQQFSDLYIQHMQYQEKQAYEERDKNGELAKNLAENDKMWEGIRTNYQNMLKQDISEEEKKELRKYLADIDKQKAESKRQIEGQYNFVHNEIMAGPDIDPDEISDERMLALKRNIRKNAIGQKIWGFDRVRDFRNGFAAVCYAYDKDDGDRWGFVNRQGRLAIPCVWNEVYNFNNQRPYSLNWKDHPTDEDDRPWTSVRKGHYIGMIDTTGTVRIPVKFRYSNRPQIVFNKTEKGEAAAARDGKTRKWGLINRKGDWIVQPKYQDMESCLEHSW